MTMTTANGSGWVVFQTIHDNVASLIMEYAKANPRNDVRRVITGNGRSAFIWHREPDAQGHGVRQNNEEGDFLRLVANAVFKFAVSTVHTHRRPGWDWNYRRSVEQLVMIMDKGWVPTGAPSAEQVKVIIERWYERITVTA